MVLPLVPIAVGLGGAALGGAGAMTLLGGGKKSETVRNTNSVFPDSAPFSVNAQTYSPHSPYEQFSQGIQYSPVTSIQYPGYAVNINSPEAVASTKKEMTTESRPNLDYSASQQQNPSTGTDLVTLALIAGAAIVAYGVVSR